MAEVLEIVLQNLSSLIQKELSLSLGVHGDLESLASMLTTIKAILEDAEEKQFTSRAIKDWLQKVTDTAYVLDEILNECATKALRYEEGSTGAGPSNKVRISFLSSLHPKHVAFRYKIAKKIRRIRERLDEVATERSKFHLNEIVRERRSGVRDSRETTSNIDQPQVYGRDEDRDQIVDFLINEASELEDLSVYPLIGIGGLGKTTLAKLIFNHERIVNHFELRIWVCVSEDFTLKRMTRAIIESVVGNACGDIDLEPLHRKLSDLLHGKRYLLVLDDVWDEEQENWWRLRSVLARGGKGASVLVTTRLQKVAAIMGTIPPHDLSMLSDSDCWELFKQRAFAPNEEERADLVVLGKEIVEKCGGVPLAAITLGSSLRFKRDAEEWLYVKENNFWSSQSILSLGGADTIFEIPDSIMIQSVGSLKLDRRRQFIDSFFRSPETGSPRTFQTQDIWEMFSSPPPPIFDSSVPPHIPNQSPPIAAEPINIGGIVAHYSENPPSDGATSSTKVEKQLREIKTILKQLLEGQTLIQEGQRAQNEKNHQIQQWLLTTALPTISPSLIIPEFGIIPPIPDDPMPTTSTSSDDSSPMK